MNSLPIVKVTQLVKAVQSWLAGKKTYLTGIASVATGLANGDINLVLTGLSVIFLRNAISK